MAGHHHSGQFVLPSELSDKPKIILVGNPNVGKSIFFGYLSKQYTNVSNYPGTTIDLLHAQWNGNILIDTPGIYSVSSFNDEERIARDIILQGDIILNIVDAVRLERDLFLTKQLIDMGKPLVIALNFMDDAKKNGLEIDVDQLSESLGVPVIPTTAKEGIGLQAVEEMLLKAKTGKQEAWLQNKLAPTTEKIKSQPEALLLLEGDKEITERHSIQVRSEKENIFASRRRFVDHLVASVVYQEIEKITLSEKIGRLTLQPLSGTIIFIFVVMILYQVIGIWIAGNLVNFTEVTIMQNNWNPFVENIIGKIFAPDNPLYIMLAGEFGLLTMTITYILGLLLPLVIGFYLLLSILEDSGYLPRLATFVDHLLMKIGLNGRAVIPLILGFGCVQLGTMTTRLLTTDREKRITTSILNYTIPCSAQLGVITLMLGNSDVTGWHILLYVGVMFGMFVLIGTLLNKILPGKSRPLLMDLPPMRLPKIMNLLRKTWLRTYFFLKEATPWFFLGAFVVTFLQVTGGLMLWQKLWAPITKTWLKLPEEAANSFIMGMIRRDFGAAGLINLDLNPMQVIISLTVITLFVPCIAAFMILLKERGAKEGLTVWIGSLAISFGVGGIIAQIFA